METFTEDTFEFWEGRILGGDEGAGFGIMDGLRVFDGMGEKVMGDLLANKE